MKFAKLSSFLKEHRNYFLALLLFISLYVLFFNILKDGTRNFYLISDEAALELRVVNATKNIQYLGPYSRFGWNHPGPIYFYLLLPFYALFSMGTQSLYAGATFINILSLLTILYFIYKNKNNYFFYFMAFLFSWYIYFYLGLGFFRSIWNPYVTILPFAAIIFICVYLSQGNIKVLPLLALFATFVVQTHVAYVPAAAVIIFCSLLLYGIEKWKTAKENAPPHLEGASPMVKFYRVLIKKELKIIGITIGLLAILWLLPILDIIKSPRGNLLQLVYYFLSSKVSHGIGESIIAVSSITNAPLIKFLQGLFPGLTLSTHGALTSLFIIQLLLTGAAGIVNFLHKKKYLLHLLIFGMAGLLVSVVSTTKITGEIHTYLIKWMSVIGFINWCAICFTFLALLVKPFKQTKIYSTVKPFSSKVWVKHKKTLVMSTIIIISTVLFIQQQEAIYHASQIKRNEAKYRYIGEISDAITGYVEKNNMSSFLLKPVHTLWTTGAGVANQLFKSSIPFSLGDNWLFWFGYQFRQKKEEKNIIFFKWENEPGENIHNRYLIYHGNGCSVYHKKKD